MAKTYYPGAVKIANTCHRYLSRYQAKLAATVTTEQNASLTALLASLADFLAKWPAPVVQPFTMRSLWKKVHLVNTHKQVKGGRNG